MAPAVTDACLFVGNNGAARTLKVFVSYCHEDSLWVGKIRRHLSALIRDQLIDLWTDGKLLPGGGWETEIYNQLYEADLVLLLMSASFFASDFCYSKELRRALEHQNAGRLIVVPIAARECDWGAEFARLACIPPKSKPLQLWKPQDKGLTVVATGLRRLVETIHAVQRGVITPPRELTAGILAAAALSETERDGIDPAGILESAVNSHEFQDTRNFLRHRDALTASPPASAKRRQIYLPHLLDRDQQDDEIAKAIQSALKGKVPTPLLLIVEGEEGQAHDALLDRLENHCLPREAADLARSRAARCRVNWPETAQAGVSAWEIFGPRLARALQLPSSAQRDQVAKRLERPNVVTIVKTEVTAADSSGGDQELLNDWISVWDKWPGMQSGQLLIVALSVVYASGSPLAVANSQRLREAIAAIDPNAHHGVLIRRLTPLGPATARHVREWLDLDEVQALVSLGGPAAAREARGLAAVGELPMEAAIDRLAVFLDRFRKVS